MTNNQLTEQVGSLHLYLRELQNIKNELGEEVSKTRKTFIEMLNKMAQERDLISGEGVKQSQGEKVLTNSQEQSASQTGPVLIKTGENGKPTYRL
ncbi:hypothetical protein D3C80_1904080 [compost metagenome]